MQTANQRLPTVTSVSWGKEHTPRWIQIEKVEKYENKDDRARIEFFKHRKKDEEKRDIERLKVYDQIREMGGKEEEENARMMVFVFIKWETVLNALPNGTERERFVAQDV